jgi:hypothetical protein
MIDFFLQTDLKKYFWFVCVLLIRLGWYPQTLPIFFNFEFEFNIDFDFDFELVSDLFQSTVLIRVNSRKSAETKKLWIGFPVVGVLSLSERRLKCRLKCRFCLNQNYFWDIDNHSLNLASNF